MRSANLVSSSLSPFSMMDSNRKRGEGDEADEGARRLRLGAAKPGGTDLLLFSAELTRLQLPLVALVQSDRRIFGGVLKSCSWTLRSPRSALDLKSRRFLLRGGVNGANASSCSVKSSI